MKYSFKNAVEAKETGKFLAPGIKNATFENIEYESGENKNGEPYKALVLNINIEGYGAYSQKFFEPKSDERTANAWGGLNASAQDNFTILVREIVETLNPELLEDLADLDDVSFKELINFLAKKTKAYTGKEFQVKLLPNTTTGYASIPIFIARITNKKELAIGTWVFGQNLTLNDREKKAIDNAQNAHPTNMANNSVVEQMKEEIDADSDLPF